MSFAKVQTGHNASTPTLSDTVTLGAAPTAGNLLLIFVQYFQIVTDVAINTAKYTIEAGHSSSGTDQMWILSRYADGTETATLPTFQTSATTYFSATVIEISGVNGTHSNDFEKVQLDNASAGGVATITSTSYTTTHANDFAVTGYCGDGSGGGISSVSGGWTADESQASGATIGYSYGLARQAVPTSGTVVQNTVTFAANNSGRNIGLVVLKPTAGSNTGTATMTFSGVTIAGTGRDSHSGAATLVFSGIGITAHGDDNMGRAALALTGIAIAGSGSHGEPGTAALAFAGAALTGSGTLVENAAGSLAFHGIGVTAAGLRIHVKGTATLAFGGIMLAANGIDPGTGGVRQFWTFE